MKSYEHLVRYFIVACGGRYALYSACACEKKDGKIVITTTFRLAPCASCFMKVMKLSSADVREVASYNVVHFLSGIISVNDLWDSGEAVTEKKRSKCMSISSKAIEQKAQAFLDAVAHYREGKKVQVDLSEKERISIDRCTFGDPLEYVFLARNVWRVGFQYIGNAEYEKLYIWVFSKETAELVQNVACSMGLPITDVISHNRTNGRSYSIALQDGTIAPYTATFVRKRGEAWEYAA